MAALSSQPDLRTPPGAISPSEEGDETTGYDAAAVRPATFTRLPRATLDRLCRLRGLTATASDVLDELGLDLAVSADALRLRGALERPVAGHVQTLSYLPERRQPAGARAESRASRLAHHTVLETVAPSDVLVVEARVRSGISVFGGMAALAAARAGVGACIVDGGVRDLADIRDVGLAVWSRSVTPVTGKWRVEAAAINAPVACGGVQVRPGDLALADETGVCSQAIVSSARTGDVRLPAPGSGSAGHVPELSFSNAEGCTVSPRARERPNGRGHRTTAVRVTPGGVRGRGRSGPRPARRGRRRRRGRAGRCGRSGGRAGRA
jgi:4-hydroxy-4-methyl-2-oxoglutarate aldolase